MLAGVLITIFLFYFFAILQSSFFAHFNLFGAVPNFVFILFFLSVFFASKRINYIIIIYAIIAGLLLDLSSYKFLGLSAVLLIAIAYFEKKLQTSLKERDDKASFVYFSPIFLICLVAYELLIIICLRFLDSGQTLQGFDWRFLAGIIYNLFFAIIGFWIFKKIMTYVKKL